MMDVEFAFGRIFSVGRRLCVSFPTLFNLAIHKDDLVRDVWDYSGVGGGWISCFNRSFNDWEMRELENFLHVI